MSAWRERAIGALPYLAGALLTAGLTHIVSILIMPSQASQDAFARLAGVATVNRAVVLPPLAPGSELLPFEDPAMAIAVCRYDVTRGPVRLRATPPGDGLMLFSFHNRVGATHYAMNDRGALRGRVDVVVATREQIETIETFDPEDELPQELRLQAPSLQGFVMVRSLAPDRGAAAQARASLSSIECAQESATR